MASPFFILRRSYREVRRWIHHGCSKKNLAAYKKLAKFCSKIWMEHGAIDYVESIADDVKPGKVTSFPQAVKLKQGEVVIFAWATYASKGARNRAMKKIMADPRLEKMTEMPFDGKRMIFGGFQNMIALGTSARK